MGRPQKEISEPVVRGMARVGATDTEIGEFCNVTADTIKNRFSEVLLKERANMRIKLRRVQMKSALNGNVVMMIWLGKQILGQSDKNDGDLPNAIAVAAAIREALREIDAAA